LGESFLEKMEIDESFFGKKHGKLAHLRNLAPKIIYDNCLPKNLFVSRKKKEFDRKNAARNFEDPDSHKSVTELHDFTHIHFSD
jgi:hypothetical protein